MKRAPLIAFVLLLVLTGCSSTGADAPGTRRGSAHSDAPTTTAALDAGDTSPPAGGRCDAIVDAVNAMVPGTSTHADRSTGGFELCKWESSTRPTLGLRFFFQVSLANADAFTGLSSGLRQSMRYMTQVKRLAAAGFDEAVGYWNGPTRTFALLVKQGDRSALLEGSTSDQPQSDALTAAAHTLVG